MKHSLLLAVLLSSMAAVSQDAPHWERTEAKDPFTGAQFTRFILAGKYLSSPSNDAGTPFIGLRCKPEPHGRSGRKFDGKLLSAILFVGETVVDANIGYDTSSKVVVQYRLDDGKIQTDYLYHSNNFKAVSLQPPMCGDCLVNNILYGHAINHKENTSPQIKKVMFKVPEFLGADVVIQFDLPDSTEVASVCGITYHK